MPNTYRRRFLPKEVRFWDQVAVGEPRGCWEWQGARLNGGYGVFHQVEGGESKARKAHRAAWQLSYGDIPDGLQVRHRCDNRSCVKPTHLELGTHHDNMRDMRLRGRAAHKIDDAGVTEIRRLWGLGHQQTDIARQFGLDPSWVSRICRREVHANRGA